MSTATPEFGTPVEAVLGSGVAPKLSRSELALTLAIRLAEANGSRFSTNSTETLGNAKRFLEWLQDNEENA